MTTTDKIIAGQAGKEALRLHIIREVRRFQERGGLIKTMPADLDMPRLLVGGRHTAYETVLAEV